MQRIQPSPTSAAPRIVPVAITTRVSTLHPVGARHSRSLADESYDISGVQRGQCNKQQGGLRRVLRFKVQSATFDLQRSPLPLRPI